MPPPCFALRVRPDGLRRARLAVALDFAKFVSRRHFDGIIPGNGFRMVGIATILAMLKRHLRCLAIRFTRPC